MWLAPGETDMADAAEPPADGPAPDAERIADLLVELEELTDTPAEREQVREAVEGRLGLGGRLFGRVVAGFDRGDLAEALLGSVLFGIPMAVEGGTGEVGAHLAARPLAVEATLVAAVAVVVGILYVSELQDVRVREPLFGVVPRRLAGVVGVAALTAVVLLTLWGRVDWARPGVAVATCAVAFVPMAIGAALSDILPGT